MHVLVAHVGPEQRSIDAGAAYWDIQVQCARRGAGARGVPLSVHTATSTTNLSRVRTSGVPPLSRKAALASARLEAVWTRSSSAASSRLPLPPFTATTDLAAVIARRHLCRVEGGVPPAPGAVSPLRGFGRAPSTAAFMSCTPVGQPATPSRMTCWRAQGGAQARPLSCGPEVGRGPRWEEVRSFGEIKPLDFTKMGFLIILRDLSNHHFSSESPTPNNELMHMSKHLI